MNSFGFVMSFIYAGLGIFLLAAENVLNFSSFQQYGFGVILIAYGFFRFYNAYKKKKRNELEEDNEE